ncbi:uncharacterized protein [Euphorbia lathyris]|uniref:uncharacterized protein n=1 Tax=Euphorbia lathyris TaxID=212925 RepID=UPI003313EDB2
MDCLILPISILKKRSRLSYRHLPDNDLGPPVTVVVGTGREKKEFTVDPFILDEIPFRLLMDNRSSSSSSSSVIFVEYVDAILFEHMLWLVYNDSSSLFKLDLPEIIEFYTQH